jgi:flagellar biosynthesis chaperone FliJ
MDKLDLIIDKIDTLKDDHGHRLDSIDDNLKEHMKRSENLEKIVEIHKERIDKLEEPKKALKYVKSVAGWIVTISSAGYAVAKFFKLM